MSRNVLGQAPEKDERIKVLKLLSAVAPLLSIFLYLQFIPLGVRKTNFFSRSKKVIIDTKMYANYEKCEDNCPIVAQNNQVKAEFNEQMRLVT